MAVGKSPPNRSVLVPRSWRLEASQPSKKSLAIVGDAVGSSWWALVGLGSDETKVFTQNHVSLGAAEEDQGLK